VAIAANRYKGVRCGIAYNDEVARLMRAHNDANVISFGARFTSLEDAIRRVELFLNTNFEGGRHQTRVEMLDED
jgi:ribose 5-phosphate isomerase B